MQTQEFARRMRRTVLEMAHRAQGPHVGSALSCCDIIATLYNEVLRLDSWSTRDIFVLSKAHAAMALYAALHLRGLLSSDEIGGYCLDQGSLPAHTDRQSEKGIEISAGSLGHGFNIALGMALGFKKQGTDRKVYCVIGDGESQEGSIWEGALFAPSLHLDNVNVIMDYNNLQGYGRALELCHFEPLAEKWEAMGWDVHAVDGHNPKDIYSILATAQDRPRILLAKTTKGKGVSFMEDQLIWHYYMVTDEHLRKGLEELQ